MAAPMTDSTDWNAIRSVAESGVLLPEVAERFGLPYERVKKRAQRERWLTVAKVQTLRKRHTEQALSRSVPLPSKEAVLTESLAELGNQVRFSGLRAASSALAKFAEAPPELQNWSDAKVAVEIAAKIGNWGADEAKVQVNLWQGGASMIREVDSPREIEADEPEELEE
jgi:hypothetical protein